MDFRLPDELDDIRLRTRAFVEEHIIPVENDRASWNAHDNISYSHLRPLQEKARAAGLWSPQAPKEWGGMGLPVVGWAAMYED
ncbi:MAG: acyl-CoA dehydrogenase family protein, partial [Beijerinckiaceae bacterium]